MKRFTFYFPNVINAFLTKDVGIIPFIMQKHYGYESTILTSKCDEKYPDAKRYLENIKIDFYKDDNELVEYLRNVDVLMIYGIYDFNLNIINYYKYINPEGKIYLKLDANMGWMKNLNTLMNNEILEILKKCDLISAESIKVRNYVNAVWGLNVKYSTNGYYEFIDDKKIDYDDKENIIMFAGRIGTQQKSNHILLEAFKNIENKISDWKVVLAGNIEDSFKEYLDSYFKQSPYLKDKVIFLGSLNKSEIKELYKKSKIFCLTSIAEGAPNVVPESIYNGCYVVSTDVDTVDEVTDYGKYGSVFPINDVKSLENILTLICNNDEKLRKNCELAQEYAREKLDWVTICSFIKEELEK